MEQVLIMFVRDGVREGRGEEVWKPWKCRHSVNV